MNQILQFPSTPSLPYRATPPEENRLMTTPEIMEDFNLSRDEAHEVGRLHSVTKRRYKTPRMKVLQWIAERHDTLHPESR